jgi:hypothetical protein
MNVPNITAFEEKVLNTMSAYTWLIIVIVLLLGCCAITRLRECCDNVKWGASCLTCGYIKYSKI